MQNKLSLKRILKWPQFSITVALILLVSIFGTTTPAFLTLGNAVNMARQTAINLIIAIAATYIMTLGCIDLSIGSTQCFACVFAASFIMGGAMNGYGWPIKMHPVLAIICGLGFAAFVGFINGLLITKLKLAPLLVTLASQTTFRGLGQVYTNGYAVSGLPAGVVNLGKGTWFGIPIPAYIALVLLIIAWLVLEKTKFGRYMFAIGGNQECARLSGIKIDKVKIIVYVISATLAGIAGMLIGFRMGSAQLTIGTGTELDAITAAALGGTVMSGGRSYMLGSFLGCTFLSMLSVAFNIAGINSYWQQVLKGIILVLSILISSGSVAFNFKKKKQS